MNDETTQFEDAGTDILLWARLGQGLHLMVTAPRSRCCLQTRGALRRRLPEEPQSECLLQ